jgi:Uma2 family endonuclease
VETPAPEDQRFTVERYFALAEQGVLEPDDRVELLEGVVVAVSPRSGRHDAGIHLVLEALRGALGPRAVIRVQSALLIGQHSAPEPDVAVVPGAIRDYDNKHPTSAYLVVEVADSTLPQDRITKARMYAGAGIPEYWIVNLRDDRVEVFRDPDATRRVYRSAAVARAGERLSFVAYSDATVAVGDLLPARPAAD